MKGVALGILALAAVAYWPAGQAFFVKDDISLISGAHLDFTSALFHSWPGGFFRPAAEWSYALQYRLFGLSSLPYHLVSFAAHLAAACCVYRLCLLWSERRIGLIAATLFVLHPLNTESVSWISGQMSLISGLCGLTALYLALRGGPVVGIVVAFVLGQGFYENFPIVLLVWAGWHTCYVPLRHWDWRVPLALGLCTGFYLYWRFGVLQLATGYYGLEASLGSVLTNGAYYLYLLAGGSAIGGRIVYYNPGQIGANFFEVFPPLLILTVLLLAAYMWQARKNGERPSAGLGMPLLWILLSLLPLLVLGERPRRLAYLAVPGYSMAIGHILIYLHNNCRFRRIIRTGVICFALVLVSTLYLRNRDWLAAGDLERSLSDVVADDCRTVAFDVPNLLGDALFFHSVSTAVWLAKTGPQPQVYPPHEWERIPARTIPCYYRYTDGHVEPVKEPPGGPTFVRGRNWARSP